MIVNMGSKLGWVLIVGSISLNYIQNSVSKQQLQQG